MLFVGMPQKSDDSYGVRTPEAALGMPDQLELIGRGYFGRYAPLTSKNVQQLLLQE